MCIFILDLVRKLHLYKDEQTRDWIEYFITSLVASFLICNIKQCLSVHLKSHNRKRTENLGRERQQKGKRERKKRKKKMAMP